VCGFVFLALRQSGHGGNTTVVVLVSAHPDVTVLSPARSPGVLNNPVIRSAAGSPSDGQDSVIQLSGRASWLVVDSRSVQLEGSLRSVNGNRGGTNSNLGLEIALVSRVDVDESSGSTSTVGWVVLASSILGGVRIRSLGVKTLVGDDVGHGLSHETSVASLVSLRPRAIHQILLRERGEFALAEEVASLGGSSGGKGPARSALLLVLDLSDGTLGSPIP